MIKRTILERELVAVAVDPSQTSFQPCARVMCDQTRQVFVTVISDEPAAIQRMEARRCQRRRIADVVQERRSDQRLSIVTERTRDALGCLTNSNDMIPPPTERNEMMLRGPARPRNDRLHTRERTTQTPVGQAEACLGSVGP